MSSIAKKIRDSPKAIKKKLGRESYDLASAADDDPFAKGINFHVVYLGSGYHPTGMGNDCTTEVLRTVFRKAEANSWKVGTPMSLAVTDKSLRVKDLRTKMTVDEIPLHRISYCGTDKHYDTAFAFVAKEADTGKMKVHVTKADSAKKVRAMCMTVSKAFNIAYRVWQYKQKRSGSANNSPAMARAKDQAAAEVARASPKNSPLVEKKDKPASAVPSGLVAPALAPPPSSPASLRIKRVPVKGPSPVSTPPVEKKPPSAVPAHLNVDDGFSEFARARSHPDLLASDTMNDPDEFNFDDVKDQADPGSVENLLDL
ncbi:low density lipoprotein receptor adapter protein 1-A-like [Oscarella lobularis]|uniref:low density lipoprotein receptor adapter protein 1-A-like n=1 Tax=Oscarella lobularis TaxID=121494 RepID=UPI0033132ADA